MENFVQDIFNAISLEKDPDLWQDTSDSGRTRRTRLTFLGQEFPETRFEDRLRLRRGPPGVCRGPLAKNPAICEAFFRKATGSDQPSEVRTLQNAKDRPPDALEKQISLLNQALGHAPCHPGPSSQGRPPQGCPSPKDIILARVNMFNRLGSPHRAEKDLKFLSETLGPQAEQPDLEEKVLGPPEKVVPHLSDKVKVVEEEAEGTRGRYVVATQRIEPGELVAVDTPEFCYLDMGMVRTHCWHCLRSCDLVCYPCASCSGVAFCSSGCQTVASETYHRYECGVTDLLYQANIGAWVLAHRATASLSLEYLVRTQPVQGGSAAAHGLGLVTHNGLDLFSAPALMKEALVAVFLTRCLEAKGFFDDEGLDPLFDPVRLRVAEWVHHFMRIAQFNSHEVTDRCGGGGGRTRRVGVCINPTLALVNHSCDPNYGRVWVSWAGGSTAKPRGVLAFATRTIEAGEEICDSYSGVFGSTDLQERQITHARYLFECRCHACLQDWPQVLLDDVPSSKLGPQSGHRCANSSKKSFEKLSRAIKSAGQSLEATLRALKLAEGLLERPHRVLCQLEDQLHSHLNERYSGRDQDLLIARRTLSSADRL